MQCATVEGKSLLFWADSFGATWGARRIEMLAFELLLGGQGTIFFYKWGVAMSKFREGGSRKFLGGNLQRQARRAKDIQPR